MNYWCQSLAYCSWSPISRLAYKLICGVYRQFIPLDAADAPVGVSPCHLRAVGQLLGSQMIDSCFGYFVLDGCPSCGVVLYSWPDKNANVHKMQNFGNRQSRFSISWHRSRSFRTKMRHFRNEICVFLFFSFVIQYHILQCWYLAPWGPPYLLDDL